MELYLEIVEVFKDLKLTRAERKVFPRISDGVFSLGTLLVNVLTESHYNGNG